MVPEQDAAPARPASPPSTGPAGRHEAAPPRRSRSASVGLAGVLVLAGLLFTTSAQTSRSVPLRAERGDASEVVLAEEQARDERTRQVAALTREVEARTAAEARVDSGVAALQRKISDLAAPLGAAPVRGPGLVVTLDDAPRGTSVRAGVTPDDLVVHQQDVQAVVNALWSGGAEAMMLMDQRVISTSAVRCVGNTLLLQGRVYSPPYRITAIGDLVQLRKALAASGQVQIYQQYVTELHLGFDVRSVSEVTLPGFDGPLALRFAHLPSSSPAGSASLSPASPAGSASGAASAQSGTGVAP
jgi:uncharacterized protein YlxW (UPF0749 family)